MSTLEVRFICRWLRDGKTIFAKAIQRKNKYRKSEKFMIGKRVKEIRLRNGLKQQAFALRIGTSSSYISEIESGKKIPGGDILLSLKREFPDIDLNWLLTGEGQTGMSNNGPMVDFEAEQIGKRILRLTGKRRRRIDDVLDDQEELEAREKIPSMVLARESGIITLNLLWCMTTSATVILAAVGLNILNGPTALRALHLLPYCWIPVLVAALIFRKAAVRILKHRFVSLVTFKSAKFGEG